MDVDDKTLSPSSSRTSQETGSLVGGGGVANGVKQSKKLAKEGVQPRGVRLPFPVPRLPLSHCRAWSQAP